MLSPFAKRWLRELKQLILMYYLPRALAFFLWEIVALRRKLTILFWANFFQNVELGQVKTLYRFKLIQKSSAIPENKFQPSPELYSRKRHHDDKGSTNLSVLRFITTLFVHCTKKHMCYFFEGCFVVSREMSTFPVPGIIWSFSG